MPSIHIIYASTGGHAKHVADTLTEVLTASPESARIVVNKQSAQTATRKHLLQGDVIVLVAADAHGEEHVHADMKALLDRAKDIDLEERFLAFAGLSLSEDAEKAIDAEFRQFIEQHNGRLFIHPLLLTGEDLYAYEKEIRLWADKLLTHILHQLKPAHLRKRPAIVEEPLHST
ncbi:flavodoxin family protein [Candidatus Peregrinibacteria bacterium]|nr:flavodoxin family protein [Candidatus Peregrinibacteria bacterium]